MVVVNFTPIFDFEYNEENKVVTLTYEHLQQGDYVYIRYYK